MRLVEVKFSILVGKEVASKRRNHEGIVIDFPEPGEPTINAKYFPTDSGKRISEMNTLSSSNI